MSAAPVTDQPRPWYRHPLGMAYLLILGLVAFGAFVATVGPVGGPRTDKAVILLVLYSVLDMMTIVPLAFWVVRRKILRLSRYPAVDLLLGLFLFALAEAAVVVFLFFACVGVTRG